MTAPRQILPGGYISFVNLETDEWQQILFVDPSKPPQLVTLGPATGKALREWIDNEMAKAKTTLSRSTRLQPRARAREAGPGAARQAGEDRFGTSAALRTLTARSMLLH